MPSAASDNPKLISRSPCLIGSPEQIARAAPILPLVARTPRRAPCCSTHPHDGGLSRDVELTHPRITGKTHPARRRPLRLCLRPCPHLRRQRLRPDQPRQEQ